MNCPACGTENDAARKFCMECGAPLTRACPACGAPNPGASKFCGECGTALAASAETREGSAAPAVTATERRLVSVLFLDLVSFTTLSEQRDAEDMRELLSAYFETARTVIDRHGGVVEKFIGDAVMAVWGTPVAHEDDAERAVRAALELVDAVAALGATTGAPLLARGGVLTGEAATMPGGGEEGMVTGDMVNTASRLQSAAEPGQVFVGEATFRAASRAVSFDEVGDLTLKGKEAPVRAWRAVRMAGARRGTNPMAVEPSFVGRTEELRLLKELLHATDREGKARVVSVTGIGGIGKSRLAWELLKYIDGLPETLFWHQGRCPAYGDGITFWALGEMVRMRARIAETDAPAASRTKLAASIAEHVPDPEDRQWLEPRLAFLLGLGGRPAGGREELFAAWRTFFERISDSGTVVMVFEDLQWADAGLLDFIESMLEWSRNLPILIVTLARPELVDRRPTWGAGQRSFAAVHLEPLPDEAVAELVLGMLPGADDAVVMRIVERAEGVPLYAVETIRMLADRGVLRVGDGVYELVGDLGELHVPETLHALIASRLDALGPDDRTLLQDAAVLGKSFTLASLGAVSGTDGASLEPRLQDLARKEFLLLEADPRSPERGQYAFVQGIIREVAYGMLSKADRRARHLATAHHFEAAADDELAGVVAAHYVEALRVTPEGPDADALAARARDWLGQAAGRATSLGSPEQALVFAEQALDITPPGRERAGLLVEAARAAGNALQRDRRISYLHEAVATLRELEDLNGEVATMGLLSDAFADVARAEEQRAVAEEMRERLSDGGDELARACVDGAFAWVHLFAQELGACLRSIDRALAGYERAQAWDRFAGLVGVRSHVLANLGRHREAMMLRRGILEMARGDNDLRLVAETLNGIATALTEEDLGGSLEAALESAAVARRGGYGEIEMIALSNAVEFAVECGAWARADELLEDLEARPTLPVDVEDTIALGTALLAAYRGDKDVARAALDGLRPESVGSAFPTMRAWVSRVSATVHLMAGDLDLAYEEAMAAVNEEPEGMNAPIAVWFAGRAALWLGEPTKARAPLDLSPPLPGRTIVLSRRALEAGIAALEGRTGEAASAYGSVLADWLGNGDPFDHALTAVDAVAVLPADLVPDGAVETARAYLEELGAAPLLARLARTDVPVSTEP
ncbi:MAG TPA: adenylate/guanylate cyclase domain-containing protein [Actinomycetota bacterium]